MKTKKINIPLSDQVVDLETARELTEKLASVGIEVDGAFTWERERAIDIVNGGMDIEGGWLKWRLSILGDLHDTSRRQSIPAQTLPELLAVLPDEIDKQTNFPSTHSYLLTLIPKKSISFKRRDGGTFFHHKDPAPAISFINEETNPAAAAAKLLIWCIDNGYIKVCGE